MAILLEMTLTGGVLILLVLLLRTMFLNRLPKTAFIVMWAIVLLRLLLPVSFFGTATAVTVADTSEVTTVEAVTPTEETEVSQVITLDSYDSTKESEAVAETTGKTDIFGIIWLIGAVLCGIVLVISYVLSFRRFSLSENLESEFIASFQRSNKLRRTVTIKLSDKTTTPFTYGIIHPVILLPMDMDLSDEKQLKYVLMHEYIHIRKLDNLLKGISSIAVCIHWFNPLVWVMNKFLSRDIELRCDETLLKNCEGDCRAEYALTLIDLEDKRRRSLAIGTAFAKEPAEERVRAIMKYRKATPSSAVAMILCITMLCMAFVGCGAVGTAGAATEVVAESEEELSAVSVASAIAEAVADSGVISEATRAGTITISVNDLISANAEDCNFDCIAYDYTLPDGLYFDDGVLYNADGEAEGKLKAGDEYMVIDGTGDAAEGYMFVIIDFRVSGTQSLSSYEDTVEAYADEMILQYEEEEGYSFYNSNSYKCYPIYESVSQTETSASRTYNLTSYKDASTVSVKVTYGEFTYTYAYTSFTTLSYGVRLIYIVPENETNISLYFG